MPNLKKGEKPFEFDEEGDSFWVQQCAIGEDGKLEKNGRIRVRFDILPAEDADKGNVGSAREEPNHSPFCPPPVGRLTLSLNPCKMFQQLVGPSMRKKIYCACCCIICLALCIYMLPTIMGGLITNWITNLFGGN